MKLSVLALFVALSAIASGILVLTGSVSKGDIIYAFLACVLTSAASVKASKNVVVKN